MWKNKTYTHDFLDEMIDMTVENYGLQEAISHKEFVQHEYFENPAGDALIELACDDENNILAGQYVVNPKLIYSKGTTIKAILSLNTLTRAAYRGQKIFTSLAEITYQRAANEGYAFCYGAPNPNSHPGFIKKLSFIDLGEMPLYVKPLKTSQMVQELTKNKLLANLAVIGNPFFRVNDCQSNNIVQITESNVKLMDSFWDKIKDKYTIMGVRDSAYIHYRYLNVPIRKYHPYFYVKDGIVVAYAVGRVREVAHMQCGMIADFLYLEGYEKEARELIKHLVCVMKENGAGVAGCIMQSNSAEAGQLKKIGFIHCPKKILPQPTPIIYRKLRDDLDDSLFTDWNNWFFTTGDYDVV
ncbi:MAG: GNAT family N-acetyltransferase [Clostridiaceae bacterium]|nr:GNAT family N-acetyltransferase [Clostridiaceae bacterium]